MAVTAGQSLLYRKARPVLPFGGMPVFGTPCPRETGEGSRQNFDDLNRSEGSASLGTVELAKSASERGALDGNLGEISSSMFCLLVVISVTVILS
jgi:hypothetical protein